MRIQVASQKSKQHNNVLQITLLLNNLLEDAEQFWKIHRFPMIFKPITSLFEIERSVLKIFVIFFCVLIVHLTT